MTRQAENCVKLLRGQDPEKIEQALKLLHSSVVNELMEHYNEHTIDNLAYKLYLIG